MRRTLLQIGMSGALISLLALGGTSARAQTVPATAAGANACALAAALPSCVDGVVASALGAVLGGANGGNRGGPLHANGGRDFDVAAHHGRMLAR